MKQVLSVVLVLSAVAVSGCKSACRQLYEKQCDCQQSSFDRNTCLQRAATSESVAAPTAAQNEYCQSIFEECNCRLTDTPEGKRKCGLSRPAEGCDADRPDGGSLPDGGACP